MPVEASRPLHEEVPEVSGGAYRVRGVRNVLERIHATLLSCPARVDHCTNSVILCKHILKINGLSPGAAVNVP